MRRATMTILAVGLTSISIAQSPAPPADPANASSPHQRAVTGSSDQESMPSNGTSPADASTPHQRDALKSSSGTISAGDFVSKAGMDGMTEVQIAQIALQKSQSEDVKKFAQQMVKDHGKANTELKGIAGAKQLTVPSQLDSEHQAMVQSISEKSGSAFDAAYASQMAKAHDKAIALFTAAKATNDPDIAAFATKTLPTLQMHKQMVTKLQAAHAM